MRIGDVWKCGCCKKITEIRSESKNLPYMFKANLKENALCKNCYEFVQSLYPVGTINDKKLFDARLLIEKEHKFLEDDDNIYVCEEEEKI